MSEAEQRFKAWFETLDEETQEIIENYEHGLKSALIKERQGHKDALKALKNAEVWSEDIKSLLKDALMDEAPPTAPRTYRYWIKDVSVEDAFFVYEDEQEGGIYKRAYILQPDGSVLLSDPEEVRVSSTYTAVGEAAGDEIFGDAVPLVEKALADDGTIPIKLIQPGWGTSGYYSPELLERDGPKIFKAGTQMFWDHPTESEERDRPERSLRDLAGELVEDASWDPNAVTGPGLYARSTVFGAFKDSVDDLAPHIGLSINARGRAKEGEVEGQKGDIIQEITGARSVDFVTVPGAGGQIIELFEAARDRLPRKETKEADMADENALKEATDALAKETEAREKLETENARLREVVLLDKARKFASGKLADMDIPDMTKARLAESLSKNPPEKDGKLDEEALEKTIEEGVKTEMEYLAELSGSGNIKGLGESNPKGGDEEGSEKELMEGWQQHYEDQGFSPEEAERMAGISARGR